MLVFYSDNDGANGGAGVDADGCVSGGADVDADGCDSGAGGC